VDLSVVQEGQIANITNGPVSATGKLIFVSPVIDPETRSAKAIIELDNADGAWRPGTFVNADISTSTQDAALRIPKDSVQVIDGKSVVFVQNTDGFEPREVKVGRTDSQHIEILSGLRPGESIATSNTFTLKAELGKSEAEHEH
jgi:cobalt-zinc-cadmium efflux system membrane fusion protein